MTYYIHESNGHVITFTAAYWCLSIHRSTMISQHLRQNNDVIILFQEWWRHYIHEEWWRHYIHSGVVITFTASWWRREIQCITTLTATRWRHHTHYSTVMSPHSPNDVTRARWHHCIRCSAMTSVYPLQLNNVTLPFTFLYVIWTKISFKVFLL